MKLMSCHNHSKQHYELYNQPIALEELGIHLFCHLDLTKSRSNDFKTRTLF